jgi:ribose transport system permease protein
VSTLAATVDRVQRRGPVLQLVALVVLFLYGFNTIVGFATAASIKSMLVLAALLGLAAAGQTLVVIVGGLDLSVPGFIVAAALLVSDLCGSRGWSPALAIVVILVLAALVGATSGWICDRFQIQPLIVTLGIGALAQGLAFAWTSGELGAQAPAFLNRLTSATGSTLGAGIPPVVVLWALVAIGLSLWLHRSITGRRLYALGANPRAALLTQMPTRRIRMAIFAVSALFAAVVGILLAGFAGADPTIGDPYLFEGLTAVIIGGTTFMGARGDYLHTVIGALILTELTTILVGKGYDQPDQQIVFGVLILLVVAGYGRDRRLRDRI